MGKNRSIQQKIRKMKRRGRFAVFSGAATKYAVRIDRGRTDDEGKHIVIPVGPISPSKQVMSTGRGPDATKMQEYYQRLHSYDQSLPATIGAVPIERLITERRTESGLRIKDFDLAEKYADYIKGVPKNMFICIIEDDFARLDLYFNHTQWFFVEVDFKKKWIRRSLVYSKREYAMAMLREESITWVEQLPKKST